MLFENWYLEVPAAAGADYPPLGLEANIKKLPEWIQVGCGDKPYYCVEKSATFPSDTTPAALPDISSHNNCMTDFFKANPDVYDKLKDKVRPGCMLDSFARGAWIMGGGQNCGIRTNFGKGNQLSL